MDGPQHRSKRNTVQPVVSPQNRRRLEPLIRERVVEILDGLPVGETFDWVNRISIELTTGMMATLFNFPYKQRRKRTDCSDIATAGPDFLAAHGRGENEGRDVQLECLDAFTKLWKERQDKPDSDRLDLITALANGPATKGMNSTHYLGTLILLIVGGNDTTRNSISGGVLALNETRMSIRICVTTKASSRTG